MSRRAGGDRVSRRGAITQTSVATLQRHEYLSPETLCEREIFEPERVSWPKIVPAQQRTAKVVMQNVISEWGGDGEAQALRQAHCGPLFQRSENSVGGIVKPGRVVDDEIALKPKFALVP
ncbi:MAG: hypothetical protein ACRD8U_24230 [Pyrinomonadaceae bacterium]